MTSLETERLRFRQWIESDFDAFARFFANEDNAEYVGGQKDPEEAWRLMASYVGHYTLLGHSYVAIEDKLTSTLVGSVGLWKSDPWPELELGYWLLPEMQGKGYAFEAAGKAKDFAAVKLGSKSLVSYIHASNASSI